MAVTIMKKSLEAVRPLWVPLVETVYGPNALCLELCNTISGARASEHEDTLAGYADLLDWLTGYRVFDAETIAELRRRAEQGGSEAQAALSKVKELRETCWRAFSALYARRPADPGDLDLIRERFSGAAVRMRFEQQNGSVSLLFAGTEKTLESPLWPVAVSAAELLTSPLLERVRECSSESCDWLFLDVSHNRSRKWCDMASCGNRAKARRYHARRSA